MATWSPFSRPWHSSVCSQHNSQSGSAKTHIRPCESFIQEARGLECPILSGVCVVLVSPLILSPPGICSLERTHCTPGLQGSLLFLECGSCFCLGVFIRYALVGLLFPVLTRCVLALCLLWELCLHCSAFLDIPVISLPPLLTIFSTNML